MKHLITVVLISLSWVSSALAQDVPVSACCINDSCYEVPVEICELENGEWIGGSCETADCGCVNALDAAC